MLADTKVGIKKYLTIFSYFMVFALISCAALDGVQIKAALTGSGTKESPYLILTAADLYEISSRPSAYYKLESDINLENTVRAPIKSFKGSLDGNGYTISNLNVTGTDYVGLFGQLNGASIHNLTIEYAIVTASGTGRYAGVLAGDSKAATLSDIRIRYSDVTGVRNVGLLTGTLLNVSKAFNCSSTDGSVYTSNGYAGGFIGNMAASSAFQCYASSAHVESPGAYIGGFAGYVYDVEVEQCFAASTVIGKKDAAGFIGYINQDYSNSYSTTLKDCYAIGSVVTDGYAGGINYSMPSYTKLINCFAAVTLEGKGVAPLIFEPYPITSDITSSYFDSDIAGIKLPAARARTKAELSMSGTFEGWDFDDVWVIKEGKSYPQLKYAQTEEIPITLNVVIEVGEQLQLSVSDDLEINKDITFISSDDTLASVNSEGMLTGHKKGSVVISCGNEDYTESIQLLVIPSSS